MLDDLGERMEKANATLLHEAHQASDEGRVDDYWRLQSKAAGVRLALSYVYEAQRARSGSTPKEGS